MKNIRKYFPLYLKGIAMGCADTVPGVSGGTIAFVSGIYERLLRVLDSFNLELFFTLCKFQLSKLKSLDWEFILPLLAGILTGIVAFAGTMHFLLENYPVYTWSAFFGLIIASTLFFYVSMPALLKGKNIAFSLIGVGFGYAITGLVPTETPDALWMFFGSGMLAITAMILPGISGSFILLILGKYTDVLEAVKMIYLAENMILLAIFMLGCIAGLLTFSRVLNYLLRNFEYGMLAFLAGLMFGSLRKVWPWKETVESVIINGKVKVLTERNLIPDATAESYIAIAIAITVFAVSFYLQKRASAGNK